MGGQGTGVAATNLNRWVHVRGPRPFEPLARAEGRVDRRIDGAGRVFSGSGSPSSRRSWACRPRRLDRLSVPPVEGSEAVGIFGAKGQGQLARQERVALHPNPTSRREVLARRCRGCGTDVSDAAQSLCESYDRVEIPEIQPDVTRVSLYGGVCPCCARRFKAGTTRGSEPGSPFGPNLRALVRFICAPLGFRWRD